MEDLGEEKTQETVSNVCHLFVSSHNPYHAELHADVNRKIPVYVAWSYFATKCMESTVL